MNDDFWFWSFFIWFSSIILWGGTLTIRKNWIRNWLGGFFIIFNFFMGLIMMPVFFRMSETYQQTRKSNSLDFEGFAFGLLFIFLVFSPMFFMGYILRSIGKLHKNSQTVSQINFQTDLLKELTESPEIGKKAEK